MIDKGLISKIDKLKNNWEGIKEKKRKLNLRKNTFMVF